MKKQLLLIAFALVMPLAVSVPATMCATAPAPYHQVNKHKNDRHKKRQVLSADSAIAGVTTLGFMAADAAKLSAIIVEYNIELKNADVNADTYTLNLYTTTWNDNCVNFGDGEIGDITRIYVNDKPDISKRGGKHRGRYVIIEVYTDYQYASELSFLQSLSAGITQISPLTSDTAIITASTTEFTNFDLVSSTDKTSTTPVARVGTYRIKDIEGYKLFTNDPGDYGADGPAFSAENCFSEMDGQYHTVELAYGLFVPKHYNPQKKYALVTVDHPGVSAGTHPFTSVTTSRNPAVFASDWAQHIVKERHGLDGIIVVVPTIAERVGDNISTPATFPALVKLWDYLAQEYSIDPNHIYGAGQSVGGMMILEANTKRDNYFAGILLYDNQWGQNYYKDQVFARGMAEPDYNETAANTPRYYPSTDEIIWPYHFGDDGTPIFAGHDHNNYFYMVSDDNIMITNSSNNFLSNNTWTEMYYLYQDLTGYKIPHLTTLDFTADKDEQELMWQDFLATENELAGNTMGIRWVTFNGGSSRVTPIWSRRLNTGHEWLLSQTRESEMTRPKLALNKPFALAPIQETERIMPNFIDPDTLGEISYVTAQAGSGTQFYNTSWLQMGNNVTAEKVPGWLPEGMSHPVIEATIESVTTLDNGSTLTAVAIEYSVDMTGAIIHMLGDNILDSKGIPRDDDFVAMDSFDFYDAAGEKISCTITNIYINNMPAAIAGAQRASGSGHYVIVEIDTDSNWNAGPVGVIQRATVRTAEAIASATSTLYR